MLESMFGHKEKPKAGPKGNVKKMMNGGKVMGYKDGGSVSKPKRSAPEEKAAEVGMERQEKTFLMPSSVTMIQRKNGKVAELLATRWPLKNMKTP
jgi:hypothetical protein